jgi:hypothetical protein
MSSVKACQLGFLNDNLVFSVASLPMPWQLIDGS